MVRLPQQCSGNHIIELTGKLTEVSSKKKWILIILCSAWQERGKAVYHHHNKIKTREAGPVIKQSCKIRLRVIHLPFGGCRGRDLFLSTVGTRNSLHTTASALAHTWAYAYAYAHTHTHTRIKIDKYMHARAEVLTSNDRRFLFTRGQ